MAPFAADRYGNASGSHRLARDARLAVEEAREQIAEVLGIPQGTVKSRISRGRAELARLLERTKGQVM